MGSFKNRAFYTIKPLIPRAIQLLLRRQLARYKREKYSHVWPIDPKSAKLPPGWKGWPDGKQFAVVLSHDVDTRRGYNKVLKLADIEEKMGFRSQFNFVPERYGKVEIGLIEELKSRGFGIGVHGLNHDGKLFISRRIFETRAHKINAYLSQWGTSGFTSPAMHHKLDWMNLLNIEYSISTFDTDPFEPQPDGVGTIFPFWVPNSSPAKGFVELPFSLPQDSTLFIILQEKTIDIWKSKLDWVATHGGMVLLNSHPDYMDFGNEEPGAEIYPVDHYIDFLRHIKNSYDGQFYHALPREIGRLWKDQKLPYSGRLSLADQPTMKSNGRSRSVCILAYTFYEVDFRVIRYAEALSLQGDHVDVIALRKTGADFHEIINGVHVYRVQGRAFNEKGKFSYLFRILKFLTKSGLFMTGRHMLKRYELVHVHNVPDFLVFAAIVPKLFGAKIILDIHDILPEFYASKFNKGQKGIMFKMMTLVEKLSIGFSDHVIVSNHLWKKKLEARSTIPAKCTAIINYPDKDIFFPRKRAEKGHEMIMLYPGTINWHQGLDIAVKAFALVKDKVSHLYFDIYGSGTHLNVLLDLIDQYGLQGRVRLYPLTTISEIAEIVSNADFGVIPKRNDQFGGEAFSTKTLEFMSSGVPIILSRTTIDSYYYNDSLVQFFEPENVEDLSNAMMAMIRDKEMRNRLSRNGLEFAKKNTWNQRKEDYYKIINMLQYEET